MAKKKEIKIEEGLERLEYILSRMEEKDIELMEFFELYEEGVGLLKNIVKQIDNVEKKVQILSQEGGLTDFLGEAE